MGVWFLFVYTRNGLDLNVRIGVFEFFWGGGEIKNQVGVCGGIFVGVGVWTKSEKTKMGEPKKYETTFMSLWGFGGGAE